MENQVNVNDQNKQQTSQNSVSQQIRSFRRTKNYLIIGSIILAGFIIFGFGAYHISRKSKGIQNQITGWETYKNLQIGFEFNYPRNYTISPNPDCNSVINWWATNKQTACLSSLTLNPTNSDYPPKAYFWLVQGINSVDIPGQISDINFDSQKRAWVLITATYPPEVLSVWDRTKSGQGIIKTSNGGSHGSSYYYLIPNYKNDKVAIFSIPQSYRLRCDSMDDKYKETDCNNFYKSVINQYNRGEMTPDTWLPENYLSSIYTEAENIVKSYTELTK